MPINLKLLAERFERDSDVLIARLGPIYLQTMPITIRQLMDAQRARDRDQLWQTAHKIKGNAASISAEALEVIAGRLEDSAETASWAEVQTLAVQISAENDRVIAWLQTQLNPS